MEYGLVVMAFASAVWK